MSNYNICMTPVSQLSEQQICTEAEELRIQLTTIQGELAKRCAWERAEHRDEQEKHLRWLANTRALNAKLATRYAQILPREKEINRNKHTRGKMKLTST